MTEATYFCSCMEEVYVSQRARHEAKDHPSEAEVYDIALTAKAVSMTDAEFARIRRIAARVTEGHFGDVKLLDQFGDEFPFVEVARCRQEMGLETPGWSQMR